MTTETYFFGKDASVAIIRGAEGLPLLKTDLNECSHAHLWAYLIDPPFFEALFRHQLDIGFIRVITDSRQIPAARRLAADNPRAHFRHWSTNRTLHDKTILLGQINVAWISSYNLTTGSWTMSYNRAARMQSPAIVAKLNFEFDKDWESARPILPHAND